MCDVRCETVRHKTFSVKLCELCVSVLKKKKSEIGNRTIGQSKVAKILLSSRFLSNRVGGWVLGGVCVLTFFSGKASNWIEKLSTSYQQDS